MNKLVIVLFILVLIIYVRYYTKVPSDITFLQPSLTTLHVSHLLEKNPIIIKEALVDPLDLLKSVFRFMYLYHRVTDTSRFVNAVPHQNKARYLIIYAVQDCIVDVFHPKHSASLRKHITDHTAFISIKLQKSQCMILPMSWWYYTSTPINIKGIELYTLSSIIFSNFMIH